MNLESLLKFAMGQAASDVHLQSGRPPMLRINGALRGVESEAVDAANLLSFLTTRAPAGTPAAEALSKRLSEGAQFVFDLDGQGRFRVRAGTQNGAPTSVIRLIPQTPPTLDTLCMPKVVKDLALAQRGLTIIAGAAGSGVTTLIAAMLEHINVNQMLKVVTIENPIEFVPGTHKALITQLEVGRDVGSFAEGAARAQLLDPDTLVVGDLPDFETAREVVSAVKLGRQVIAGLNATSAMNALDWYLRATAGDTRREAILGLDAIVALRLANTREGGRRAVIEVLRGTPLIKRSILDNRIGDIPSYMTGREWGMQTFDQHLQELYKQKVIGGTEAMRLADNPEAVGAVLRGMGS